MSERVLIVKAKRTDQTRAELYAPHHKYADLKVDVGELAGVLGPEELQIGIEVPCRFWAVYQLSERLNKNGNPYKDLIAVERVDAPATATSAAVGDAQVLAELRAIRALLSAIADGLGLAVASNAEASQEADVSRESEPDPEHDQGGGSELDEFIPKDAPPEPEPEPEPIAAAPAAGRPWCPELCRAFVRKASGVWVKGEGRTDRVAWQASRRDTARLQPPREKQPAHVAAVLGKAVKRDGQAADLTHKARHQVLQYLCDVLSSSELSRQECDAILSLWSVGGNWEANGWAAAECGAILAHLEREAGQQPLPPL